MRGLGAPALDLYDYFVRQLQADLEGMPSDAACYAQSSRPITRAPALDLYDDFVCQLRLEADLDWFYTVVVKRSDPTEDHLGMPSDAKLGKGGGVGGREDM